MSDKKYLFLLGGYDLEMLTIRKLLDQYGYAYHDHKLSWGAQLSSYENLFDEEYTFVGIELEEDVAPPKSYLSIDHHGKDTDKPSSLEQVATLLSISLTYEQTLIAANDRGYIKAMQELGASDEQIVRIRQQDRKAQGVTEEDERQAERSVIESKGSDIIYAYTPKFSAISDRIYQEHSAYIIYNETTVSFYGYRLSTLLTFLEKQRVDAANYYYGGGNKGFLGFKDNTLTYKEITNLIKEFTHMHESKSKTISYHTFMLPFIYEDRNKNEITKRWQSSDHEIGYNQRSYFHDFFIASIESAQYYKREAFCSQDFIIKKDQEYRLDLEKAELLLFTDVNIGILLLNLNNTLYGNIDDILKINDYTRRLYPEYLDYDNEVSGLVPEWVEFNGIKETFEFDKDKREPTISAIIDQFIPVEKIKKAVDDRMFTLCYYRNSAFAGALKKDYQHNDRWYQYVFVDGNGRNVQNRSLQHTLITKATYSRWQESGTMYGISKYSFVSLAENDFPLMHMQTMYRSMFILLLLVRATVLKFSGDVSSIAKKIESKETASEVEALYKQYIQFVNTYYFREVTAKDQGLEIYEQAVKTLNIERDIKDLDAEIDELHKFVELQDTKRSAYDLNVLTWIGGILLPPSIVTGFFGMNTLGGWEFEHGLASLLIVLGSALIIPLILTVLKFSKKESHE